MRDGEDEIRRRGERWRHAPRTRPRCIETAGPGQESVWDYPRPPRVEPDPRRVRVELAGTRLADTSDALRVLETAGPPTWYLPQGAVRCDLLEAEPDTTLCEWKGLARYWSVRVGSRRVRCAAWSYPEPLPEYAILAGRLAFFPGRVDACTVADERVTAQPGDYYGGWITGDVVGPFKGEPGSESW
jgi:uncharacterized protein (DUF427 family)